MLWTLVNPFLTSHSRFYESAEQQNQQKTLRVEEKLLETSHFSFSDSIYNASGELSAILIKFETVACKLFQFGNVYSSLFGKGL